MGMTWVFLLADVCEISHCANELSSANRIAKPAFLCLERSQTVKPCLRILLICFSRLSVKTNAVLWSCISAFFLCSRRPFSFNGSQLFESKRFTKEEPQRFSRRRWRGLGFYPSKNLKCRVNLQRVKPIPWSSRLSGGVLVCFLPPLWGMLRAMRVPPKGGRLLSCWKVLGPWKVRWFHHFELAWLCLVFNVFQCGIAMLSRRRWQEFRVSLAHDKASYDLNSCFSHFAGANRQKAISKPPTNPSTWIWLRESRALWNEVLTNGWTWISKLKTQNLT